MFKKYFGDLKREFAGYNLSAFSKDLLAGLTVAAVALPLALAFGVSAGADAAAGLVTAIIAGIVIGILGGASYQISGPTGAMSAILLSLSATYGIKGVLTAGFLSGIIILIMALVRAGKLVSYIPPAVITGFTSGIAVIIALGQVDNFFGIASSGESILSKIVFYATNGFSPNWYAVLFGALVVAVMLLYPKKLNGIFPSSLASIIIALVLNMIINPEANLVAEVGNIPKSFFTDNAILKCGFELSNITALISPAFSIAILGMIESLLCGASAGKMKGEKLDAQRELVAQGIGNMVIPLLGGVPATAAIARTSVAIKSGGKTRLVSVFHSVTLILSMFLLGSVMSRIPLSALAGVLMVTAWRMNDWEDIRKIFSKKFKTAIAQFLVTMIATVLFDLTVAILAGVVLSIVLFVIKSAKVNIDVQDVGESTKLINIRGILFFGTQGRLTSVCEELENAKCVVLSFAGVSDIDCGELDEIEELYTKLTNAGTQVYFLSVSDALMTSFKREGIADLAQDKFISDIAQI